MPESKSVASEKEVSRDRLVELLNEDLSREYQAIIAYVVYSQVLSGARHALAAFSRPLLAAEALPGGAATGKSFRPAACRTCRSKTNPPNHDQNQTPSTSRSPLEETVEADISIWRKTGHFYFALTDYLYGKAELRQARTNRELDPGNLLTGEVECYSGT